MTRNPISIWEMSASVLLSPISLALIPYRYPGYHIDMVDDHIDARYRCVYRYITSNQSGPCSQVAELQAVWVARVFAGELGMPVGALHSSTSQLNLSRF